MFKKIQNYLLLNHPSMWNLKILPMIAVAIVIHIIFFVWGYLYGAVDFSEGNETTFGDWTEGLAVFAGILISVLLILVWLVYYFRNNAFKSYYPKRQSSLYREWLLIFLITTLNVSYPLSFIYAKDLRARNYYQEEEVLRRTNIISMASLFADGGFRESGDSLIDGVDGESIQIHRDTFKYRKRYYPLKSLLNKVMVDFTIQGHAQDSVNERRVKGWLVENRKDSVLWLMKEFDKVAKEHNAPTNITPAKWLDMVYNHPNFDKYITIGRMPYYVENSGISIYAEEAAAFPGDGIALPAVKDTLSNVIKVKNGNTYIYPKYYVPFRQLENSYQVVSEAWANPDAGVQSVLICIYIGLALSLLIFSFRVTSGRSWLIAVVAYGVTALVIGVVNLILFKVVFSETWLSRHDEEMYFVIWLFILAGLMTYFLCRKHTRGFSDILLNIIIWLMPWVLPVIAMMLHTYYRETAVYVDQLRVSPRSSLEIFIDDYPEAFLSINVLLYLIFMYFFTAYIKKWKGIAEA